jgi:predicted DNA-binding transcriptional regulator YafY
LTARVRISPRGLKQLVNARLAFAPWPQATAGTGPTATWREGVLALESVEQGALQLLSLGAEVQVVEPPALREEIRRLAQRLLVLHAPPAARKTSKT